MEDRKKHLLEQFINFMTKNKISKSEFYYIFEAIRKNFEIQNDLMNENIIFELQPGIEKWYRLKKD